MTVTIRRARADDVPFLTGLVAHDAVEPFLGAVAAREPDQVAGEVERSQSEPREFGRFVIEVDGGRAGAMGFEVANRRSRIAHLERLAVHPGFRGRGVADEAARLLQRHLLLELGYHRLQLEIYGFNERAIRHAERVGFAREGVKRQAYWRHGRWVDGVLFGLLRNDLPEVTDAVELLHDHVDDFNAGVRDGDFARMLERFSDDAELVFEGVPVGPFHGREQIAAAYRERPPDDELVLLDATEAGGVVTARYAWGKTPERMAGQMHLTSAEGRIARLVVTFDE